MPRPTDLNVSLYKCALLLYCLRSVSEPAPECMRPDPHWSKFAVQVHSHSKRHKTEQKQYSLTPPHTRLSAWCTLYLRVTLAQLLWALEAAASLTTQTHREVTTAWVEPAAHN